MKKNFSLSLKFQLFYPVLIALLIALFLFTIFLVNISRDAIYKVAENNMLLEVTTIKKMFERERELKLEKVSTDLKVAHRLFYENKLQFSNKITETKAINQFTHKSHQTTIKQLLWGGLPILNSTTFPDETHELFGGTTTIFQKIDSGFLRISTNVKKIDGTRAAGTFIPNSSAVAETINNGNIYYGRAYVVTDWYITAYEPIKLNGDIVGALYVGGKEKDIVKLRATLNTLIIGRTGFPFVIDNEGSIVFEPKDKRRNIITKAMKMEVMKDTIGVSRFVSSINNEEYLLAYNYYSDFGFHIVTAVPTNQLTYAPLKAIVVNSIVVGSIIVVLLLVLILSVTTKRVYRILNAIKKSNVKLKTTQEALKRSEENFKTIFQNSSDEIFVSDFQANIIEVNEQASKLLGYTREELLQMNILDLKPHKQAEIFLLNRKKIIKEGGHLFDSEYITKSGDIVPVEINSRVLEFNGETVILSISRNLIKRKEMERKVLSAVIQTEEKERERFSKDMHDGIGPLLSTVKLYVNELGSPEIGIEEKKEFVIQVNKMLDDAVNSIREISNNLMPRVIHEYGLVKALEAFCTKVNQTGKIHIDFNAKGIEPSLDKNIQLILFRVISELLTNTIKHAKSKNAYIELNKIDDNISLVFTDDGIGFNSKDVMAKKGSGIGLKSIVSRIKSINGSCEIISKDGEGFRIVIDI
ncbi:MAG: Cache 3/Cache 2 fusion domain-containing protein [Bacteroidota bacterium]